MWVSAALGAPEHCVVPAGVPSQCPLLKPVERRSDRTHAAVAGGGDARRKPMLERVQVRAPAYGLPGREDVFNDLWMIFVNEVIRESKQ